MEEKRQCLEIGELGLIIWYKYNKLNATVDFLQGLFFSLDRDCHNTHNISYYTMWSLVTVTDKS